jgi:glycosyltransferase involved in cell wall biosynthesis
MELKEITFKNKTVSVVIPCYNPAPGWCKNLIANMRELNSRLPEYLIQYIVSNDGSTRIEKKSVDGVVRFSNLIYLDNAKNEGKGAAIRKGTVLADGDLIIYVDIDFPFGISSVVEMVRKFENNPECQFIYGHRVDHYFKKLPVKRQIVSKILHGVNSIFLSNGITDTQAGIKGLRKELKQDVLSTKTNTFVFEIELIRKLIRKKVVIQSIDVSPIPSIVFTDFSSKVLFLEALSLSRILFMSLPWSDI